MPCLVHPFINLKTTSNSDIKMCCLRSHSQCWSLGGGIGGIWTPQLFQEMVPEIHTNFLNEIKLFSQKG